MKRALCAGIAGLFLTGFVPRKTEEFLVIKSRLTMETEQQPSKQARSPITRIAHYLRTKIPENEGQHCLEYPTGEKILEFCYKEAQGNFPEYLTFTPDASGPRFVDFELDETLDEIILLGNLVGKDAQLHFPIKVLDPEQQKTVQAEYLEGIENLRVHLGL